MICGVMVVVGTDDLFWCVVGVVCLFLLCASAVAGTIVLF